MMERSTRCGKMTNQLSTDVQRSALSQDSSLESMLIAMTAFGAPRISQIDNGWYCVINMRVAAKGAEFKIDSEIRHKTPTAAARECLQRIHETLSQLSTGLLK